MESERLSSLEHGLYEQRGTKIDLWLQAVNELIAKTAFPIPLFMGADYDLRNAIGQVVGVMGGYRFIQVLIEVFNGEIDTGGAISKLSVIPSIAFDEDKQRSFAFFFFTTGGILEPIEVEDHTNAKL